MHSHLNVPTAVCNPADRLAHFVQSATFPCVGARSAFNKGRVRFGHYDALGGSADVVELCEDLRAFSQEFPDPGIEPVTFVALFQQGIATEAEFDRLLWQHLQSIHECDRMQFEWADGVSANPSSNEFSFSVGGRAYFVVGMHPAASRLARRSPSVCLVFNFHDQFEALRATPKYGGMQKVIRQRDIALQGSINPVLARFGESSEARQYSGKAAGADWQCPFHAAPMDRKA